MGIFKRFTAPPSIPAAAWASPFVKELWTAPEDEFGWNLSLGRGSTFLLTVQPASAVDPASRGKIPCILLVEDNSADVDLVREALEEHAVRCELVLTTDGEHAIEFLESVDTGKTRCPDLIILDLNLPKKPGHEVLRRVRTSLKCNHVPVVVLILLPLPEG